MHLPSAATITRVTTILSIQSSVAYGHVGNSAATFPLMRMGVEVWPVITVHFSNHTGYESWRGPLLGAADLRNVLQGIDERGVLGQVDAVLSGYQGGADVGTMILEAVALVKVRNPAAIYCCDPVLGDADVGSYVLPGIAEFMREQVVPAAQIITPNQFELTCSDRPAGSDDGRRAWRCGCGPGLGPDIVLVTSVVRRDARPGTIEMVAVDGAGAWLVTTPQLPRTFTGSGDVTAATFLAALLRLQDLAEGPCAHGRSHLRGAGRSRTTLGRVGTGTGRCPGRGFSHTPSRRAQASGHGRVRRIGSGLSRGRPRCWRRGR